MKIIIYDSDNWIVKKDEEGNLSIAYFEDGHWWGELHIDKQNNIWEE